MTQHVHVFPTSHLHSMQNATGPPPGLQSYMHLGEICALKAIKLSFSIYLQLLCVCLSLLPPTSVQCGWLLMLVSLLSASEVMMLAASFTLTDENTQWMHSLTYPFKGLKKDTYLRVILITDIQNEFAYAEQNVCGLRLHKTLTNCTYGDLPNQIKS